MSPRLTPPLTQVIGPLCLDVNVDAEGVTSHVVGGAAVCAAAAAASLGHQVETVLSLGQNDLSLLEPFTGAVGDLLTVTGPRTSSIRNVYTTADQERRTSYALAQALPLSADDVPDHHAGVQHLAGLVAGDYSPDVITVLSARGDLAVDMQYLVREADASGRLHLRDPRLPEDLYPRIRFLKVDTAEGEVLTGLSDRRDIARALYERGASEVMVSNAEEVLVHDGTGLHACPLRPRSLAGRTGRGDTVFSAYVTERQGTDVESALLTACATVSLKMAAPGPLRCRREDVETFVQEVYADLASPAAGGPDAR